jgi:hypothetical protein
MYRRIRIRRSWSGHLNADTDTGRPSNRRVFVDMNPWQAGLTAPR